MKQNTGNEVDRGHALRFLTEAEGWSGPNKPVDYARVHDADVQKLVTLLAQIRREERIVVAKELTDEANRIFNKSQEKDYPSNVLDKVALHLRCDEPFAFETKAANKSDNG